MSNRPNLFGATSFDGSLAITFKRAVTNIVCDNTMAAGLAERGQQVKIKHSRHSKLRIGEARQALNIVYEVADAFTAQVRQLCQTSVTSGQWAAFLAPTHRCPPRSGAAGRSPKRSATPWRSLWRHDSRVAPWAGTGWGVLQAVNTYVHHEQAVRGAGRVERNYLRAVTGGVDDLDRETLQTLGKVLDRPVLAGIL